jgi:hypothetical protein
MQPRRRPRLSPSGFVRGQELQQRTQFIAHLHRLEIHRCQLLSFFLSSLRRPTRRCGGRGKLVGRDQKSGSLSLENPITHIKSTPEAGNEHRQVNQAFHPKRLYWIFCLEIQHSPGRASIDRKSVSKSLSQKLACSPKPALGRTDIIVTFPDGKTPSKPAVNNVLSSAASPNTLAKGPPVTLMG